MLANMRDHFIAIHAMRQALADMDFDTAADVAETRSGMSSLLSHGTSLRAPYYAKGNAGNLFTHAP